jgi:hypothetical protein
MSLFDKIRTEVSKGLELYTPSRKKPFTVFSVESDRIVFCVGVNDNLIPVPKECWNDIPDFLRGKGWIISGPKHDVAETGTFNEFLDKHQNKGQHRHPDWASYVVPMLVYLKIVEVRMSPTQIRLKQN